jgi:hypothetical protein
MHNGNKLKAARELGISRCYLHRLLNQLSVAEAGEGEAELQDKDLDERLEEDAAESIATVRAFRSAARIA